MDCDIEKEAFTEKMNEIQLSVQAELKSITQGIETQTKELSDKFEKSNDTAKGVGAAAGTAVGGYIGGAAGAAAGAEIGKAIGQLFVIETGEEVHKFSLDLPEVTVKDQNWSFDVPEVTMADTDIIFDVPTLVMKTVRGPDLPVPGVRMDRQCIGPVCFDVPVPTVTMQPTYLDVPTWENRQQRIVMGVPQVTMKTQGIVVGVPEVTMRTQEFSFSIPTITIRFVKDASQALADATAALAKEAQNSIAAKTVGMQGRMRNELLGPAIAMFACYRGLLVTRREAVAKPYNDQLDTIANTLIKLKAQQVPDTDGHVVAARAQAESLMLKRNEELAKINAEIAKFDATSKTAMDNLLGNQAADAGVPLKDAP